MKIYNGTIGTFPYATSVPFVPHLLKLFTKYIIKGSLNTSLLCWILFDFYCIKLLYKKIINDKIILSNKRRGGLYEKIYKE